MSSSWSVAVFALVACSSAVLANTSDVPAEKPRPNTAAKLQHENETRIRDLLKEVTTLYRQVEDAGEYLLSIAVIQARLGDTDEARKTFDGVYAWLSEMEDGPETRMYQESILQTHARLGFVEESIQRAQSFDDPFATASGLGEIGIVQAQLGNAEGALRTARLIPNGSRNRSSYVSVIGVVLAGGGHFEAARKISEMIPVDIEQANALIARWNAGEQLSKREDALLLRTREKMMPLLVTAQTQAESGMFDDGIATAQSIPIKDTADVSLLRVVQAAAERGKSAVAQRAFGLIKTQRHREVAREYVAIAEAKDGKFDAALAEIERLTDPDGKGRALLELAVAQAKAGQPEAARETFAQALSVSQIKEFTRADAQRRMAAGFFEADHADAALQIAGEIKSNFVRVSAIVDIATLQAKKGQRAAALKTFAEASQLAMQIGSGHSRASANEEIAAARDQAGDRPGAVASLRKAADAADTVPIGGGTDVLRLCGLAVAQGGVGDREGAAMTLGSAWKKAFAYSDENYVAKLAEHVARAHVQVQDTDGAVDRASTVTAPTIKAAILLAVALELLGESAVE